MNFTFGIITDGHNTTRVDNIIKTIIGERIPNYEIIVIGDINLQGKKVKSFAFDESIKPRWITKKKNLITENASYENIVYMHDYLTLVPGWYNGFLKFGNDFDVCITKMINQDGGRYRDWTLWAEDAGECGVNCVTQHFLLPYDIIHLSKYQYISGAYWIAKTELMKKFPLDETRSWGEGEDVEWSKQVRQVCQFKLNAFSSVQLTKYKSPVFNEMTPLEQDWVRNLKLDSQGMIIKS